MAGRLQHRAVKKRHLVERAFEALELLKEDLALDTARAPALSLIFPPLILAQKDKKLYQKRSKPSLH